MAIHQNTLYQQSFSLTAKSTGLPTDISTWAFQILVKGVDGTLLLTLTTAGGGVPILDGPNGRFQMTLTPTQTLPLPLGKILFEVFRTDDVRGLIFLFSGATKVKAI